MNLFSAEWLESLTFFLASLLAAFVLYRMRVPIRFFFGVFILISLASLIVTWLFGDATGLQDPTTP